METTFYSASTCMPMNSLGAPATTAKTPSFTNRLSPHHLGTRSPLGQPPVDTVKTSAPNFATIPNRGGTAIQGVILPGSRMLSATVQGKTIQRRLPAGVQAFQVNLQRRSGGWQLPKEVQGKMEAALGANFSDVRVHVGPEVSSIGAIAFTWGTDIHFAPGYYNPHTLQGQQLLGHELAHVIQQRAGRVNNPFGGGTAVVQDNALEAEADRLGMKAASYSMPRSQ